MTEYPVEIIEDLPEGVHISDETTIIFVANFPDEEETLTSEDELHLEEELRGRHIICTCSTDPDWCEVHGGWN